MEGIFSGSLCATNSYRHWNVMVQKTEKKCISWEFIFNGGARELTNWQYCLIKINPTTTTASNNNDDSFRSEDPGRQGSVGMLISAPVTPWGILKEGSWDHLLLYSYFLWIWTLPPGGVEKFIRLRKKLTQPGMPRKLRRPRKLLEIKIHRPHPEAI